MGVSVMLMTLFKRIRRLWYIIMAMDRLGGYTLIEVMIFLAVSSVLFISAVALIQGQQGRNQFSQSIRDIESKITQYSSEISASYFPSNEKYSCTVSSLTNRPTLTPVSVVSGPKAIGTNEDCIFLGKALQFHRNSGNNDDTLYVYSVLGRRTTTGTIPGGGTTQVLVNKFTDANPTPSPSLVETYTLPFGTKVKSACTVSTTPPATCPVADRSAMAGFYIDLSQAGSDPTANKSASLTSYQYTSNNIDVTTGPYGDSSKYEGASFTGMTYSCLTLSNPPCSGLDATNMPSAFKKWIMCFKSAVSNQSAQITVTSGPTGVQTKADFVSCT